MATLSQQSPSAPTDPEEYQQHIDNIFSLKRPRDIKAGLASGGKSALKGIAAGTVGLLAAPVVGAYTDGLKGFGQGVCAGSNPTATLQLISHGLTLCLTSAPLSALSIVSSTPNTSSSVGTTFPQHVCWVIRTAQDS